MGTYPQFIDVCCDLILEYAKMKSIQASGQGRKSTKANRLAQLIEFNDFANWVLKNYKNDKGGVSGDVKTTSDTNVCTV